MIIIPVKEGESIDRALKRYKRKYEKTGVVKELRNRQKFTKPSVITAGGFFPFETGGSQESGHQ